MPTYAIHVYILYFHFLLITLDHFKCTRVNILDIFDLIQSENIYIYILNVHNILMTDYLFIFL